MAPLLLFYIVSFLIHSIQPQQYFVSNQDYLEYADPYTDTSWRTIKVAYPINQCTKVGNHITLGALHSVYQCSVGSTLIYGPCATTESQCLAGNIVCNHLFPGANFRELDPGESCPNAAATTSNNFMQINFYCGYVTDSRPNTCPLDTALFSHRGIAKFATNVCVDQGNGDFYMATCNNETGEIGIYDSAACDTKTGTYRQYIRGCDNYAYPDPVSDSCNYFRRITACMVNGGNILAATALPTTAPSGDPSIPPTNDPSLTPSLSPSIPPTSGTQQPSAPPSTSPTHNPSIPPTIGPSKDPTAAPTTVSPTEYPTSEPTEEIRPDVTIKAAGAVLSGLNNLSLMYIVCSILFVFYLFIGGYIWMNERRKRREMTDKFRKDQDKDERRDYLRKKNLQRRIEIQHEMVGIYGGYEVENGQQQYQQMDAQVGKAVKPVDVQLLQEGM